MKGWVEDGDYYTISFVTHKKEILRGSVSVRKGSISVNELGSIHHGKTS